MIRRYIPHIIVSTSLLLFFGTFVHVLLTSPAGTIANGVKNNWWMIIPSIIRALSVPTVEAVAGGTFMLLGIAGGIAYPLISRRKK